MIIITAGKLKFLRAGRILTIPANSRYRKGRTYSLGLKHNKTVCRVEVLDINSAAGTMRIRIANVDQHHFLAARSQYGYTTDPALAMRDEPEAVSPRDVDEMNARTQRDRVTDLAEFRKQTLATAEALAEDADRTTSRKLRNVARIAKSL